MQFPEQLRKRHRARPDDKAEHALTSCKQGSPETGVRPIEATPAQETHLYDVQDCVGKVDIEDLRQGDTNIQAHCEEGMGGSNDTQEAGWDLLTLSHHLP